MLLKFRYKSIIYFTALALISLIFIPSFSEAATKQTVSKFLVFTKYTVGGAFVTFPITISHNYSVTYSNNTTFDLTDQWQGGVIYRGWTQGYYPFTQSISSAKVEYYQNNNLKETWNFSWDNSQNIYVPGNQPWNYVYTSIKKLPKNYTNKLTPIIRWSGNGTIPNMLNLTGNPIYF